MPLDNLVPRDASPVSDPFLDDGERERSDPGRGDMQCYQKCPNFGFSPNSDLCTEIVLIWYDFSYQDQH